jgi:histo-blood group ABO system transferase
MKIGLLVIATNKYADFVPPLLESARKYFVPEIGFDLLCFTDRAAVKGTRHLPVQHSPWPGPTLYRFRIFNSYREILSEYDYLFYCDADMRFVAPVGSEIIADSVATSHPVLDGAGRDKFTYETNPASRACIRDDEGSHYFIGAFFGGTKSTFLTIAEHCSEAIDDDLTRDIIAVWHDESHLNRYFLDHPPALILSPSYCFPQDSGLSYPPKLMVLNKDHDHIRASRIGGLMIRARRLGAWLLGR